jgi:2-dehydro-3-deoxygluconokinase
MSKKVVTLGEIMLRLSTPDFKRFVQADSFDITYGGGEANVAAALCNHGLNGTFVTKVPNNPIGQSAINHLRRYGVDTHIHRSRWRSFRYLFFRNWCFHESISSSV